MQDGGLLCAKACIAALCKTMHMYSAYIYHMHCKTAHTETRDLGSDHSFKHT